jgi:crotonobetainyl-CoA:carnitine CoA-transferase CaiB-like acyl-CoA transferase
MGIPTLSLISCFAPPTGPWWSPSGTTGNGARVVTDLAADARLATNAGRVAHRTEVVRAVAERVRTRDAAVWLGVLDEVGVPCGVVRTVREALRDVDASPTTGVAPAVPGQVRLPPPRLDEHGALIRAHGWHAFERITRR